MMARSQRGFTTRPDICLHPNLDQPRVTLFVAIREESIYTALGQDLSRTRCQVQASPWRHANKIGSSAV